MATSSNGLLTQVELPAPVVGSGVLILRIEGKGIQPDIKPSETGGDLGIAAELTTASASASRAGDPVSLIMKTAGVASDTSIGPTTKVSAADAESATSASTITDVVAPHVGSHAHITSSKPDPGSAATPAALQATASLSEIAVTTPISAGSLHDIVVPAAVLATVTGQDGTSSPTAPVLSTPGLPPGSDAVQPDAAEAPGQVGALLLTLASSTDGTRQISVSLHPKELGTVRVQLELAPDGTAKILVAASEPGTLRSLMANQDHLHAALDAASIAADGRHLSFELEPATTGVSPASPHHPDVSETLSASDRQAGANISDSNGSGRQDQGGSGDGNASRRSRDSTGNQGEDMSTPFQAARILTARLLPYGSVNITA